MCIRPPTPNGTSLRVGSFNVRGLQQDIKRENILFDLECYHLDIITLQETHLKGTGVVTIATQSGKQFNFYYGGIDENQKGKINGGVGIIISKELKAEFKPVTERICMATIKIENRKYTVISAYAPTLPVSESNPNIREEFYQDLNSVIQGVSKNSFLIVGGDFNAKTGSAYENHKQQMGKFGRGELNSNGEFLLDLAATNDLVLTNTLFKHKHAHRTTWESPDKPNASKKKVRNQIDYILVRGYHKIFVNDSRSYAGTMCYSDHRLVMAKFSISWQRKTPPKAKTMKYDIEKLKMPEYKQKYQQRVRELLTNSEGKSEQDKWNNIVEACHKASQEVLGKIKSKKNGKVVEDPAVKKMSEDQKKIRLDINATEDLEKRKELQIKRNQIKLEITKKIREVEKKRIVEDLEKIEKSKDDSTRMYKAIRKQQRNKPKDEIMVDGTEGMTANEKEATDIVTDFFKNMFNAENQKKFGDIPPSQMKIPFTKGEVGEAIKSLKNNKSAGIDDIVAEQLKYGPEEINQSIAELLNEISRTGNHPKEVKEGILVPLPKPGKKKGPPGNLRPIILLSMLRKILAICMIRRTHTRLNHQIPISQAAYRNGRSTTELMFSLKVLAEKAITSSSYEITVLLLDMTKAFDTVDRGQLFEDLKEILEPDELHMIAILLKNVSLTVRIKKTLGEKFTTNVGVPQGDCLSPVLFTYYLAKALKEEEKDEIPIPEDHSYCKKDFIRRDDIEPSVLVDHTYSRIPSYQPFTLSQQYADDIGWISVSTCETDILKKKIPEKLKLRNLNINQSKTEEYTISRKSDDSWKSCKYVGSHPDTTKDFQRRKGLALGSYQQHRRILESNRISLDVRIRVFNAYITSIFLYNSELWSLNATLIKKIDCFHRNLLRKILKVKWPFNISNKEVYRRTKEIKWSHKIKKRRFCWTGHLLRLHPQAPAKQALAEALIPAKRPPGRPKTTWISSINEDLMSIDPTLKTPLTIGDNRAQELAEDRERWRKLKFKLEA